MTPRIFGIVTVVGWCLCSGAVTHADDRAIAEVEKGITQLDEAFRKGDAEAIKRLVTADHIAITPYYGGSTPLAKQLATLGDLKMSENSAAKRRILLLNKETAAVVYELTMKGTFKGKELARKSYVSAVWVKTDGGWREALYQETALDGK